MMRRPLLAALVLLPAVALAQASPYVPHDDPRLPLFEHLVATGVVRDPTPMVRPFRRADALAVLAEADTTGGASRRLVQELRAAWVQDTASARWQLEARIGADAATMADRDPLHPIGDGKAHPYGELLGAMTAGPFVAVSRNAVEPRLTDDPTWPGRHNLDVVGRMAEGYVSGQWHWARIFYGTMDRQWGPAGIAGIPLSNYGYPRTDLAFEIGTDRLRLTADAAQLIDARDSTGARIHRYWFAHRLAISPSHRLAIALWETTIITGADRDFDARWRNPAAVLLLSDQYGLGADGNIMVGSDLTWWARPHLRLEGQFALDDLHYPHAGDTDHTPSRYAFTVAASGRAAAGFGWKVLYSEASSLAFRTFDPNENYVDAGVGLGRGYASNDQLSLFLTRPVTPSWMVTPELTFLRQGAVQLTDSFPSTAAHAGDVGPLFIGTVEKTLRLALGVSGAHGPVRATANVGVHYLADADHVAGRTRTELQARIRLTIGLATGGRLQ